MKNIFFIPGGKKVKVLKSEQLVCLDETHLHNSPIQNMFALEIGGHFVEVTQDGVTFNARIDESLIRCGLTLDQAVKFVKDHT